MLVSSRHRLEIIAAIQQGNSRVTVGDVATATGLDVWLVERALMGLAVDVGGHLQVGQDGDIAYVFPRNLKAVLVTRDCRVRLQNLIQNAGKILLYLLRISFGIVLIGLTIASALALAVVLILLVLKSDSNGDGIDIPSLFDPSIFDAFFRFDPQPLGSGRHRSEPSPKRPEMPARAALNFCEAIYSILFGDGNPNADLEERRWRLIASLIRHQQGVIIAEQIFPFLDQSGGAMESEDEVLPALVRFNGQPHVSPAGDLVYCFPELQLSAQGPKGVAGSIAEAASNFASMQSPQPAPYLEEHRWRFSSASSAQKTGAGVLVILLLLLSLALSHYVSILAAGLVGWSALLAGLATVGMGYSCACMVLPTGRYLWLAKYNAGIAKRNAIRRQRVDILNRSPSRAIRRKLAYARQFAQQRWVDASKLIYTSERGLIEQELENDGSLSADWQQRLNSRSTYNF